MELDERVMDKILADVKEIVAEADGTLRFIFYSPMQVHQQVQRFLKLKFLLGL